MTRVPDALGREVKEAAGMNVFAGLGEETRYGNHDASGR
jgi:hypothetical protein